MSEDKSSRAISISYQSLKVQLICAATALPLLLNRSDVLYTKTQLRMDGRDKAILHAEGPLCRTSGLVLCMVLGLLGV